MLDLGPWYDTCHKAIIISLHVYAKCDRLSHVCLSRIHRKAGFLYLIFEFSTVSTNS